MFVFDDKDNYRINIRRSLQMAIIAKIKRFFSPKVIKPKNRYIHIGCGFHKFNNFDNLDFYNSSFSFWKKKIIFLMTLNTNYLLKIVSTMAPFQNTLLNIYTTMMQNFYFQKYLGF